MSRWRQFRPKTVRRSMRKRFIRKRRILRVRKTASRNKIHYFKRKSFAALVTGGAGTAQFGVANYSLNAVTNSSEFTTLFDQYKIKAVRTDFVYTGQPGFAGTMQNINNPTVYTLIDTNDASTPSTINGMLEYGQTRTHQLSFNRPVCSVYFRPKLLAASTDNGSITANYNLPFQPWINTANPYVNHYGLKYGIDNLTGSNAIDIYHTYYLALKDSK